jgi:hypothetical protein
LGCKKGEHVVAGIIEFKTGDWDISSGGFRATAAGIAKHLTSSQSASAVKEALTLAVESQLYYLDVAESFSKEMLMDLKNALDIYVQSESTVELNPRDDLELHKGYLERLNELQKKVSESLKH